MNSEEINNDAERARLAWEHQRRIDAERIAEVEAERARNWLEREATIEAMRAAERAAVAGSILQAVDAVERLVPHENIPALVSALRHLSTAHRDRTFAIVTSNHVHRQHAARRLEEAETAARVLRAQVKRQGELSSGSL